MFSDYRKQGIGKALLLKTSDQAKLEHANFVWSYPKKSAYLTYISAGFILSSDWETSELGENAYVRKNL